MIAMICVLTTAILTFIQTNFVLIFKKLDKLSVEILRIKLSCKNCK